MQAYWCHVRTRKVLKILKIFSHYHDIKTYHVIKRNGFFYLNIYSLSGNNMIKYCFDIKCFMQ